MGEQGMTNIKDRGYPQKEKGEREEKRKKERKKSHCEKRGKKIRKVENEGPPFLVSCLSRKKQRSYIKNYLVRL